MITRSLLSIFWIAAKSLLRAKNMDHSAAQQNPLHRSLYTTAHSIDTIPSYLPSEPRHPSPSTMNSDDLPERGWRGSPDLWLDAAYDALLQGGIDAVKIMPLANRLKLSRTSFYWFFKDRKQLLDGLLDRWTLRTTQPLIAATTEYAYSETEAMLNVIFTFLEGQAFDSSMELAVRSWAQQDEQVVKRLQQADAERLAALREMLEKWGHDPQDADVRARTIYLVQVGYISMQVQEPIETRLERFPSYVEIYTGKRRPTTKWTGSKHGWVCSRSASTPRAPRSRWV